MSDNINESTSENIVDMSVNIAGVNFRNPIIAASGTFGNGSEYSKIIDTSLLGGICTKGLTMTARAGNKGMRIWETPSGLLNSIGLENPGIHSFLENDLPFLAKLGPVIIANLSGAEADEYICGAAILNESAVDMIELNISCPNVKAGGMAFGLDPGTAAALVAAVRRVCTKKPLMVKLSPNAPNLASVALACVKSGADALSLVNTFKAMAIDIVNRKPVFENITAGLSGPAIKPIALRMVWELFDVLKEAKALKPIIGIGGITCINDVLEFLMAGSSAVQIGSATFVNPHTMINIIEDLRQYMQNNGILKLKEIGIRE
jgi:dihydroorotate dehydrogenase (NAD+) catalytic subunit